MMTSIYEADVEKLCIDLLEEQGYRCLSAKDLEDERENPSDIVLRGRLKSAIDKINTSIPEEVKEEGLREVLNLPTQSLVANNEAFHYLLTEGLGLEYQKKGETVGASISLIDFDKPLNNELALCRQFTVTQDNVTKRPDIVIFINGIPLVVIELKNPADKNADLKKAFTQLQNYKSNIPSLFFYNALLVVSDGYDAKTGSLTAGWDRFMNWKTIDGVREDSRTVPQIKTLIKGMLRPDVLLDLIKQFTVFEKERKEDPLTGLSSTETVKKIAAYHQYYAVNKAVESTLRAAAFQPALAFQAPPSSYALPSVAQQPKGDRKAGVLWHTQGSGKSLSMVFYVGKIVLELDNPSILVITDRNDLDDQLFNTFAASKRLLRQDPVQADDRAHLKKLLKTSGGGIIFSTIQKFFPEDSRPDFELLSERKNIVVIADEAHRSQYGFGAKTLIKNGEAHTKYGFAKYLRDALPNASCIGFTGTPIEKEDASTPAVFGNYIDVYDVSQAVEDGATVRIYYESRLAKVQLKKEEKERLDAEVEEITENQESTAKEKAKAKWAQLEAIVGHKDRLKILAEDIIKHFESRQGVFEGKGMIVTMSRRIAVALYEQIVNIRPDWHSSDKQKGSIKVIMTSSSSDPESWQGHSTTKQERKELGERFKDPKNSLRLIIVRDMWLTGFDVPCLHTMYVDKMMRGHNLMQAIARVNRVYKDKPGGVIVDYIGIASDLKYALAAYAESGAKGSPALDQSEAVAAMQEKYEIVAQMFHGFDYKRYFRADIREKMTLILEAQEHILSLQDGKNRFTKEVLLLSKTFALCVTSPAAVKIRDELGFFQALKARLTKFEPSGKAKSDVEIETAIRQIVDKALVADKVVDVFDAAGLKRPEISILSEEFLEEVRGMERKNIALELLKKILSDEIKIRSRKNFIQSKKLSEILEKAIKRYQSNLLSAAQVIEELINVAKEIKSLDKQKEALGLSEDEIAFYDALAENDSAKAVLGDTTLRELAVILVQKVKENTSIDWTIKESVGAKLRVVVKRTLRKYGYPPDKESIATDNVLQQAELFADVWSSQS